MVTNHSVLGRRRAGILCALSSLPGAHGMGDFGPCAYDFLAWLHAAKHSVWQWLPLGPCDEYHSPYRGISSRAGNPLLVALEPLMAKGWLARAAAPTFPQDSVDYPKVGAWRLQQLRWAYEGFCLKGHASDKRTFQTWAQQENSWLDDYAMFMSMQTQGPWWVWPTALARRNPSALERLKKLSNNEIRFWQFVQWCFYEQLHELRLFAKALNILLVGDLPLYVAPNSVDCWAYPELFGLDENGLITTSGGLPPDEFAPAGQVWNCPTYNWKEHADSNFSWWVGRLAAVSKQSDVVRLDHVQGLVEYYSIPTACPENAQWHRAPGDALMQAATAALPDLRFIAEDLGGSTPALARFLETHQLAGMRVLQFGFAGDGNNPHLPHHYCGDVVAYTGTHDNNTLAGWWAETSQAERRFANVYMGASPDSIREAALRALYTSHAGWAITPLQDALGLGASARMNTPGTTLADNWRWRLPAGALTVNLQEELALLATVSGRA